MAKPTGPLLSLGASGTIAKTLTFSKWKGRPYVRQRVIPANPKTAEQTLTRNVFTWGSDIWKNMPTLGITPWNRFAQGQVLTGRNAFIGKNVTALRTQTTVDAWIGSPGAKGGLAPEAILLTPSALQIIVDFTVPTAPTGWTLTAAVAGLMEQHDPQTAAPLFPVFDTDPATPFQLTFTSLTASTTYVASAWLEWTKPDGSLAYGASINDSAITPA